MVDVRGDVLRPPHGTTPAAVKSNESQKYKTVNHDDNQNNNSWKFVAIIIVVSALVVIVIVWLMTRKRKCYLTQIIGKRLANMQI